MMAGFLGLVPFHDLTLLPKDIEWKYLGNVDFDNITKVIEKYELIWLEKTDDRWTTNRRLEKVFA